MTGMLINLEGIDGAGKRTQSELLKKELEKQGVRALLYSYPDYQSPYGKIIRQFLNGEIQLSAEEQILTYLIDMVKDKEKFIQELNSGSYIIVDRYFLSAIAYQCANGFDYQRAKELVQFLELPVPDHIFYLDVSTPESMERKMKQKGCQDRFEKNNLFLDQVREVYQKLVAEAFLDRSWKCISAHQPPHEIHQSILGQISLKSKI